MNQDDRVVIVGGGPAGLSVARAYREMDGRGRLILLTAEPYSPYRRPPLTKEYLRGEISRDELPIESPRWYRENDVNLRTTTLVAGVDRDRGVVETENGEEIYYDACVLATGSEPIRLPIPGADDPAVPLFARGWGGPRQSGGGTAERAARRGCLAAHTRLARGLWGGPPYGDRRREHRA